jgi:hypothetical protein
MSEQQYRISDESKRLVDTYPEEFLAKLDEAYGRDSTAPMYLKGREKLLALIEAKKVTNGSVN